MEIFAFTQNSVGYEDPGAEPQLRSFDDIHFEIPKSAIAGVVGTAAAVAVIGTAPDAHALVQPGARCAEVGTIQQTLNSRGFAAGPVDNIYGPSTASAVRNFQVQNGLLVDGVVGPNTATAMGLSAGISCGTSTPPVSGTSYTVTASALNVRATASTAGQVITTLPRGTQVNVSSVQGGWAKLAGQAGWVSFAYLSSGGGTPPVSGTPYTVTASALNVRATPSTAGQVLTTLSNGTQINVSSFSGGWAKLADRAGWVSAAYITGGGGSTPTPPVGGGGFYTVKASALNVRATPSPAGQVITSLPNGTRVNITSVNSDGWAKLAGQAGWVAFYLLE